MSQTEGGSRQTPLSPATRRRLDGLFRGDDRNDAEFLLETECGANLPFCQDSDPVSLEPIRFAALKVSNGDIAKLLDAVQLAQIDWRDLLVTAGFGEDVLAHERWMPDDHAS